MSLKFKSRRPRRKTLEEMTLKEQKDRLERDKVVEKSFWKLGHEIIKECLHEDYDEKKSYVYGIVEIMENEGPSSSEINIMLAKETAIARCGGDFNSVPADEIVAVPAKYFLEGRAYPVASFFQVGETESQISVH